MGEGVATVADSPYTLLALLIAGIMSIMFGALNKSTSSFGIWLNSLRRIGADAKAADLVARDAQIENLSRDLATERTARQHDRQFFENELKRRDDLSRDHVKWDWQVYNALLKANLITEDTEGGPPPLF